MKKMIEENENITAEEYIKRKSYFSEFAYKQMVTEKDALMAVEMARKEEREKAMDAFYKVLSNMTYHISRGEDYGNVYRKFNELLNK